MSSRTIKSTKLRRRAEEQLQKNGVMPYQQLSNLATERRLYELQLHQVELEMQNEELTHTVNELEAQAEQYRNLLLLQEAILAAVPVGISRSLDRKTLMANKRFSEMTGYSNEEILLADTRLFYSSQEEYERFGRNAYLQLETKSTFSEETSFRRKDGTEFPVIITGTAINPDDPAFGFIWTFEDISERRQAEIKAAMLARAMDLKKAIEPQSHKITK